MADADAAKPLSCYHVDGQTSNVTVVKIPYNGTFEQPFLLSGDRHWDNPASNQEMQYKHLKRAVKINAGIIDVGDFFCAMQGKFDKRSSKDSIRPEHCHGDYLDTLVDTATDAFEDYAHNFIRISRGNHEQAIKSRHETDLTKRFVDKLNERTGASIHVGGYSGWVQFVFTDMASARKTKTRFNLWHFHGFGGGGPVTKGTIQTARRAAYVPDAHIIATGHIHEEWNLTTKRDRITTEGVQYQDEQVHIQIPSYKEEYGDGAQGWHVETGKPPKPIGAVWLTFHRRDEEGPIEFDVMRAK